jgi:predicted membrane-bound mannosyltransferase/DNA-binding beta-propeller fold protein YncE
MSFDGATAWVKENWPRHWEVGLYALLIIVAAGLHFWDLGSRAFNHDESLHATYSWYLYMGRGYQHDPMMHGPFQFVFNALIFKLSAFVAAAPILSIWAHGGATDYTARVLPAVFGTALVGLPYFLRGHIGRLGALLAALFFAISPVLLFFGRFARNDIYVGFWTLAMVILIWRYLAERRPLYLYIVAAVLALGFATKEVTFMTVALFIIYLDLLLAWEFLGRLRQRSGPVAGGGEGGKRVRKRAPVPAQRPSMGFLQWATIYVVLVPVAWLIAITWPFTGALRRRWGLAEEMPAVGDLLLVMGTLAGAQYAAAVQVLPFVGDKGFYKDPGVNEDALMKGSVFFLIIAGAYFGLLWRARTWLICAGIFYAIYVLLYTTFFTNMGGFWSGIWGSLDYWLMQQGVRRGDQPVYYYLMILPMYEFLPVVFGLAGLVFFAIRRRLFTSFLIFWAVGSMIAFAMAGEKMPWLTVHMAVPIIILAAKLLNDLFEGVHISLPIDWRRPNALILLAAAAGALAMIVLWAGFFSTPAAALALLIGVFACFLVARAWRMQGLLQAARVTAALVGAALMILTIRAADLAAYAEGRWPNEMLSYADMSPDIPWVRDQLVMYGQETGLGHDYPIVVDNDLAWPFVWYLRDFKKVQWASGGMPTPVKGSIVVLTDAHESWMDPYLDDYQPPVSIRHLWWFGDGPGYYDDVTIKSFFRDLFKGSTWSTWRNYFIYRQPPWGPPPNDAWVYFPKSVEEAGTAAVQPAPPIPTVTAEGQLVIGTTGSGRGQFSQPAGLAVDAAGNLYVADSRNNRIQKFDPQGMVTTVLGQGGDKEATFNEPWKAAVDKSGNVYVADTWSHRILKFDPNLDFVKEWGKPFTALGQREPDLDELFGPRDIAIDADGNLLITDTGNKRVVKFTPDGEPLEAFGKEGSGPGEFDEPVGIAIAPNGDIYVADTWNRRVQRFDSQFNYISEFTVRGWGSTEVTAKPYLVVLADGRVILSNPVNGRIEVYDQGGNSVAAWDLPTPSSDVKARPIGLALSGQEFLYVSDCAGNVVYRLALADLAGP